MSLIRINLDLMRRRVSQLDELAQELSLLSNSLSDLAGGAPSYGGQFKPRVRGLGLEAQARGSRVAQDLEMRATQLNQIMQAFEQVENEGILGLDKLMTSWLTLLSNYPGILGDVFSSFASSDVNPEAQTTLLMQLIVAYLLESGLPAQHGLNENLHDNAYPPYSFYAGYGPYSDYYNEIAYALSDLPLDMMEEDELLVLASYLGLLEGQDAQSFTAHNALSYVGSLQEYWGYDNQEMVTVLRELYYPTALDPFIMGANEVDGSIFAIEGDQNGVSQSEAALGYTLLMLSRQQANYGEPILPIVIDGKEIGFDHVISGLDGYFNDIEGSGVQDGVTSAGLAALGSDPINEIESVPAVTWQGDLGGVTWQALNEGSIEAGYSLELPFEDLNGDAIAIAIIENELVDGNGTDLAESLAPAFDPNGEIYSNRFESMANAYGLFPDPETGQFSEVARQNFIDENLLTVRNYGLGLYGIEDPTRLPGVLLPEAFPGEQIQDRAAEYAEAAINTFLDELEARIE